MSKPVIGKVAVFGMLTSSLLLGGCTAPPTPEPAPVTSSNAAPVEDPVQIDRQKAESALQGLVASHPAPSTQLIVQSLTDAGFADQTIEATLDVTPTGNKADFVDFGIPTNGKCLVGQVRDKEVIVDVENPLGQGNCLVVNERK